MPEHKILIIEDDKFLRNLIVTKLIKEGFGTAISEDGAGVMNLIINEKPNLIVLDIMLPAVNGLDILTEVRKNETWKDIKVIIFSNLKDEQNIKRGLELDVTDYLVKANVTLDELVKTIKSSISK
ncbi:MAG: response regulator [bacterium]|nr:response regulator [bacterium]